MMSNNANNFGIVKSNVIKDPSLSVTSKALYSLLSTFVDKQRICYPSISHLAELLGVHRRTVERSIKELKDKRYIDKQGKIFRIY